MKKTLLVIAAMLSFGYANAQMKLGSNPTTTNADALLEMETTNKGLLLPRVALTSTTAFAPLTAHVAGMAVYNTATAGDVTAGYYFNDGTKWVKVADAATTVGSNIYTANGTLTSARTVTMGANNLSFAGTGNVGIGTATPAAKLEVVGTVKLPTVATTTVTGPYEAVGINTGTGALGTFTSGASPIFVTSTSAASPGLNAGQTVSARIPLTTSPTTTINTLGIISGQDPNLTLSDGSTNATMDYFQVPATGTYRLELGGTCGCNAQAANGSGNYIGYNVNLWKASTGSTAYTIIDDFRALSVSNNTSIVSPITPASFIVNLVAGDKVCFRLYLATASAGNNDCGIRAPVSGNQSFSARAIITKL